MYVSVCCLCVSLPACIHACTFMNVSMPHAHSCTCMCLGLHMCSIYMWCVHLCVYYVCAYMYTFLCLHACVYACVCTYTKPLTFNCHTHHENPRMLLFEIYIFIQRPPIQKPGPFPVGLRTLSTPLTLPVPTPAKRVQSPFPMRGRFHPCMSLRRTLTWETQGRLF